MKKVCFVPVDDKRYFRTGTPIMINSFRRFHPDIDLVIFRQNVVDKLFKEKGILMLILRRSLFLIFIGKSTWLTSL